MDNLALLVLQAIDKQDDHRLNVSEIKSIIGEDDNDKIRRRMNKLEDAGLVELDVDDGYPAPIPPTRATLTEEGVEKAQQWDLDPRSNDIRDREQRLNRIENRLDDIDERLSTLESAAFENDDIMPELEESRRLLITVNNYLIEELDADLGRYYPTMEA